MRKISLLNPYTVGFSTILLVIVLYFLSIDLIEQLELKTLDLRFKYSQRLVPSNRIVLVTIDNKSEDRIGRWPWGRDKHAKVIDNLSSWGAKVIGMDVIFPQPEENPVFKIFLDRNFKETIPENTVKRLKEEFDTDRILASSIERAGNVVLGYYFYTDPTEGEKATEHLTEEQKERVRKFIFSKAKIVSISQTKEGEKFLLRKGYGVETSIEEISRACKDYGFLNIFPDADGITRNAALAIQYSYRGGEDWYGSFPMQILKNYLGESNIILRVSEYGISPIAIGKKLIPNDTSGAILINYSIRSDSFPTYSFIDVMEGNVNPEEFKDKIVLIGITDPGLLRDSWATPVEIATPGIKIHANVIDTILHSRFISYSGRIELLNLIAVIFFGVILMVFIPRFSHAIYGAYLALFLFIGYRWLGYYMFKTMNVWINLVYPLGSIALVYTTEALYRNITTERKKRQIRSAFQTYVPPQVVNELIRNPEKLTLGGEKKNVSIFFSDIKEFSTISEKLSPEELVELINSYLTPMTEIIFKYEGTLDKYIGDAVVAFFGAPLPQKDHHLRVTLTALEMVERLKELRKQWEEENKPLIDIGIGINSGEVSVGNMGSKMRFDYTIMGDNVNIAQRLEQLTRIYKNNILITESTYEKIKEHVLCRKIDTVTVKGRTQEVRIYEPLVKKEEASLKEEKIISCFEAGLTLYNRGKFQEAEKKFKEVLEIKPEDGPSQYFLEQCRGKKNNG